MHEGKEIIALDLDSVLADTNSAVDKFLREKFGLYLDWTKDIVTYEFERCAYIDSNTLDALKKAFHSGEMVMDVPVTAYAEHAINKLVRANFEVYIITNRDEFLRSLTEEWLNKNNLHYDKLYMTGFGGHKAPVIEAVDAKAFIEDRFDTLMRVLRWSGQLELGLYCIKYPWTEKYYNEHIVKVDHVAEAVDRIVNFRRWKGYFLDRCVGDIDKFVKEYRDGKGQM